MSNDTGPAPFPTCPKCGANVTGRYSQTEAIPARPRDRADRMVPGNTVTTYSPCGCRA